MSGLLAVALCASLAGGPPSPAPRDVAAPRVLAPPRIAPPPRVVPPSPALLAARREACRAAARRDAWLGEDKVRHLFVSFAATTLAFGAARTAGVARAPAVAAAAAVGAAAGIGKELRDARGHGTASLRDLAWDAAGVGAGAVLAARTR